MATPGTLPPIVTGGASNSLNSYVGAGRKKSEVVIYYRRPPGGACSRWIVWNDSQWPKREALEHMGFEALIKYGPIARKNSIGGEDPDYAWAPILNHPDGPSEFPVDQIMENHWYDPLRLPPGAPEDVYFPQIEGQEIDLLPCPYCDHIPSFNKPILLARHMMSNHEWTIDQVFKLGDRIHVDFEKAFSRSEAGIAGTSMTYGRPEPVDRTPPKRPQYQIVERIIPTAEELDEPDEREDAVAKLAADRVASAPKEKAKRVQSPERAEISRMALAKARLAREEKKRLELQSAVTEDLPPVNPDPLADEIARMAEE